MVEDVTVTVDAEHLDRIDAIVAALERRGMHVGQVHGAVGVISGTVDGDGRSLGAVPGVSSVEEARTFRIPRPDAPVQ